jgi:hypothetical protein
LVRNKGSIIYEGSVASEAKKCVDAWIVSYSGEGYRHGENKEESGGGAVAVRSF